MAGSGDAPATDRRSQRWSTKIAQVTDNGSIRVVIADDNESAGVAVAAALESAGFVTSVACSGPEMVMQCETAGAHVALVDIMMPRYDGFYTAGVMRRLPQKRDTILIAYTALAKDRVAGRSPDFDGYCQKGQPIDSLVQLIRSFVREPGTNCP